MAATKLDSGLSAAARTKRLVAIALACVALLIGSSQARLGAGASVEAGVDAVFDAARATFGDEPAAVDADEPHDGRSRIPAVWRALFARFARSDRLAPPAAGGIVFVGSSSIDGWTDLPAQFPGHRVLQRGLPGATIADCARSADRLILPYQPRVVVFYAGDNDLAFGVAPEQVVAHYAALVDDVHRALPATRFVFMSIKPSPSRLDQTARIRRTNDLMAAYARTDRRLDYVDVFDAMLDRDAKPRPELYLADGLHLTAAGYALWRDALRGHLD